MTDPVFEPTRDPWAEYLAATQRLDTVRRSASNAAGSQPRAAQAAYDELTALRARLTPQRARLGELGATDLELQPSAAEITDAANAMAAGPDVVRVALRNARLAADKADGTLTGTVPVTALAGQIRSLRNLWVYGPYAIVILMVQSALYWVADRESLPLYALVCGLSMPLMALGLGWVTIGLAFPPGPDGKVDRSLILGAAVCFAPVLLACAGFGGVSVFS